MTLKSPYIPTYENMATPQEIQAALVEGKTFMEDLTEYS
jgi:hypothetical protein